MLDKSTRPTCRCAALSSRKSNKHRNHTCTIQSSRVRCPHVIVYLVDSDQGWYTWARSVANHITGTTPPLSCGDECSGRSLKHGTTSALMDNIFASRCILSPSTLRTGATLPAVKRGMGYAGCGGTTKFVPLHSPRFAVHLDPARVGQ